MRFRRVPRPAGDVVGDLAAGLAPQTALAQIQRAWPGVAGEALAAQAVPVAEQGGTVTVQCASAAWSQEITLLGPALVAALNTAIGAELVTSLRCRTGSGIRR